MILNCSLQLFGTTILWISNVSATTMAVRHKATFYRNYMSTYVIEVWMQPKPQFTIRDLDNLKYLTFEDPINGSKRTRASV